MGPVAESPGGCPGMCPLSLIGPIHASNLDTWLSQPKQEPIPSTGKRNIIC